MHTTMYVRSHLDGCDDDEITDVLIKITTTKINRMTIMMMLITQRIRCTLFAKENTVPQSYVDVLMSHDNRQQTRKQIMAKNNGENKSTRSKRLLMKACGA